MKTKKIMVHGCSVLLLSLCFSSVVQASAMPANRLAAQKVNAYIDMNIQSQWMKCTRNKEMSRDNCVLGYGALTIDDAMRQVGYSYKETLHSIAKNQSMLGYVSLGLNDFFTPLAAMLSEEGANFFVKNDLVNKSDIPILRTMLKTDHDPAMENVTGMRHQHKPNPACVKSIAAKLQAEEQAKGHNYNPSIFEVAAEAQCMQ